MGDGLWEENEQTIARERAERVGRTDWGQAVASGADGAELAAALERSVQELCEEARAVAEALEVLNQSGDMGWLKEKRPQNPTAPEVEAKWLERAKQSAQAAEALSELAHSACERGWLKECLEALGEQFAKPGRLPCELIVQRLLRSVVARAEIDVSGEAAREAMAAWARSEGFWAHARSAEFGRATRGLWGKKAPDSVFNGGLRESVGKPLAGMLAAGMKSDALAPAAGELARRVAEFAGQSVEPKDVWAELSRGGKELLSQGHGAGAQKVVEALPLSYWLALRAWCWRQRRQSEPARALDDLIVSSAIERAEASAEDAGSLREHLWLHLDKEGLSRWEERGDAQAIRDLEAWWEELSVELGSQAFVALWARKLASPEGAWARDAFAAAGFDAPETDEAAWGGWGEKEFREGGLRALRGAYASLQAEWMAPTLEGKGKNPSAKSARRAL